ncbi:MAG TPA: hypothetical protein VMW79_07750 [Anaerolineae bacterium]|nr:hypothetical protein [Anaerolineae bacterium]
MDVTFAASGIGLWELSHAARREMKRLQRLLVSIAEDEACVRRHMIHCSEEGLRMLDGVVAARETAEHHLSAWSALYRAINGDARADIFQRLLKELKGE